MKLRTSDATNLRQAVLIIGPRAAGKRSFKKAFANSFLMSIPEKDAETAIENGQSFLFISELENESDERLVQAARLAGYRLTAYFIYAGSRLLRERGYIESLRDKGRMDREGFVDGYARSFRGMARIYPLVNSAFIVKNEKKTEFLGAYSPDVVSPIEFAHLLKKLEQEVEYHNS